MVIPRGTGGSVGSSGAVSTAIGEAVAASMVILGDGASVPVSSPPPPIVVGAGVPKPVGGVGTSVCSPNAGVGALVPDPSSEDGTGVGPPPELGERVGPPGVGVPANVGKCVFSNLI